MLCIYYPFGARADECVVEENGDDLFVFTVPAGLMCCVYRPYVLCLCLRVWCIVFTVPEGLMMCWVFTVPLWG